MPKLVAVTPSNETQTPWDVEASSPSARGHVRITAPVDLSAELLALVPAIDEEADAEGRARGPLLDAMRQAQHHGEAAAAALLDVIDALAKNSEQAPESSERRRSCEALEQEATYTAIKILAQLAAEHPETLANAYSKTRSAAALDALCEAASGSPKPHRALLELQRRHLAYNTSVGALCLAQYGDDSARPVLLAALNEEVERWQESERSAAAIELGSLHLEALLEALESFEPAVPALLRARAETIVARLRGRVGAFHSMLHASHADRFF